MTRIVSRAALCGLLLFARAAAAQDLPRQEDVALHAQATLVAQGVGGFTSPYIGPNSLTPHQVKETTDLTAYLGAPLEWRRAVGESGDRPGLRSVQHAGRRRFPECRGL